MKAVNVALALAGVSDDVRLTITGQNLALVYQDADGRERTEPIIQVGPSEPVESIALKFARAIDRVTGAEPGTAHSVITGAASVAVGAEALPQPSEAAPVHA